VLVATVLALASAGMHAGWNLVAKRSDDRFSALWGQFAVAGLIGAIAIAVTRDLPAEAWTWAAITGVVHVPYLVALAGAYDRGDFSLAYPVARGGGALLAGIGGLVLLGDELSVLAVVAIAVVTAGMLLLSYGAAVAQLLMALVVALMIGIYTTVDSHAARDVGGNTYVYAVFVCCAATVSAYGLAAGRGPALRRSFQRSWRMLLLTGSVSLVTYGLVMLAVRRAPVGYVAALRESSVLVAAFIGWRYLDEGSAHRRLLAAGVVVAGLALLVVAR
jgi:drug/metabolite transporter (DMT)-like permease